MSAASILTLVPDSSKDSAAVRRYEAVYRLAQKTVHRGEAVKQIGFFLAAAVFTTALAAYQASPSERSGFPILTSVLVVCAILQALLFFVSGTRICAQGLLLMVAADSAVSSSPFLSNAQRSRLMNFRDKRASLEAVELDFL